MTLNELEKITILIMRGYENHQRTFDEVVHLFNDIF